MTRLVKLIDRLIGLPAIKLLPPPKSQPVKSSASMLLIRPGGIGDATLLIPVINELKKRLPTAAIDVLAERRNSNVFSLSSSVNTIFHYDIAKELISALRNHYDLVIDTEQWHRMSAVVARLTRAPMLIGYATNERKKLFTHPILYSHDDYEINSFLNLLSPLGNAITVDFNKPFLSIPQGLTDRVKSLLQPLPIGKVIALFPGGSIKERRWGSDQFHEVARMLLRRGYGILIVGGKEDLQKRNIIGSGLSGVVNLCGRLSITETAAALKQTSLLITGDSGIMHIGYGLGIKIVALFGPGIENKWAPRGEHVAVINKHLSCSPCTKFGYTPRCKLNVACMGQITVDEVYSKAIEFLER